MSQRPPGTGSSGNDAGTVGDTCDEAVMAAMQAISEHCDTDGTPLQLDNGMVAMAPKDEVERVRGMQPGDMTDREVDDFIEESPWLAEWTDALCTRAGLDRGSDPYHECRRNYARDAIQ